MALEVLLPIGDFAKMTYLSVKALRHYHELGVLVPAAVDPETGYRRYTPEQVGAAQVVRRLRDLGMGLEQIKAVLHAPDVATRNAGIAAHLRRMEQQLEATATTVASLRRLLEYPPPSVAVDYRTSRPTRVIARHAQVAMEDFESWWTEAFDELHRALETAGLSRSGPDGALYCPEFFQAGLGEVTAFVPVTGEAAAGDDLGTALLELPVVELAVAVHRGPLGDLDQTYGALGSFVAERAIGVDGPIRENYLISPYDTADEAAHLAEVCWPVFLTTTRSRP